MLTTFLIGRYQLFDQHTEAAAIGAGRLFVDIVGLAAQGVSKRFSRVGPGYAGLAIRGRQGRDLQLGEWCKGGLRGGLI